MVRMEGRRVVLAVPPAVMKNAEEHTVTYKCIGTKTRRVETPTHSQFEKTMGQTWREASFVKRGKRYGTVEVRFNSKAEAMKHYITSLKSEEFILVPSYMGQKVAKIRVVDVPPEIDIWWVVGAVLCDQNATSVRVLGMHWLKQENLSRKGVEILVQDSQETDFLTSGNCPFHRKRKSSRSAWSAVSWGRARRTGGSAPPKRCRC